MLYTWVSFGATISTAITGSKTHGLACSTAKSTKQKKIKTYFKKTVVCCQSITENSTKYLYLKKRNSINPINLTPFIIKQK